MIACNKQDAFNMVPAKKMRGLLENELTMIRDSQDQGLDTVKASDTLGGKAKNDDDDDDIDGSWLLRGQKIDLSKLDGELAIADGSVVTNNVESWKRWIEGVVVNWKQVEKLKKHVLKCKTKHNFLHQIFWWQ